MEYAVSVIVPVYNVEKYLAQCLDSLIMQSLESIEIIVINDGSLDDSQAIIEKYQTLYPNKIFSYIKQNGGLGDARNYGIKKAHGEFIGFIDSDDWVEPEMFEVLYQKALQDQSDLVLCDLEYFWEDDKRIQTMSGYQSKLSKSIDKSVFLAPLFAWNKLYRRSLFEENNLMYPLRLWYEDIPVTVPMFALANKISYVSKTLVHYRQRSSSIMGSNNAIKIKDIFDVLDIMKMYFVEHDLFNKYKEEIEYLYIEHLLLYGGFRFMRSNQSKTLMRKAFSILSNQFPKWRKNPYLSSLKPSYQVYLKMIQPFMIPILSKLLIRLERR